MTEKIIVKKVIVGTPVKRVTAGSFAITNIGGVDVTAIESDGSIIAYKSSTGNYEVTNLRGDDNVTVTYDSATNQYNFGFTNGTFTGSLIPDSNEAYDLGSESKKFRDLFLSGNTISLGSLDLKDSNGSFVVVDSDGNKTNISVKLSTTNNDILSFDSASGTFIFNDSDVARTDITETFHQGANVNNGLTITGGSTTDSATITGGLAVGGSTTISNDLAVGGNLTISGTTTTLNTETINLADNTIVLNSNATGTPTENAGIEVERGDDTNVSFLWDEGTNYWTLGGQTLETTGKILFGNVYSTEGDLPSASLYHGMYAHVHATGRGYFAHAGAWHKLIDSDTTGVQQVYNLKSFNANIDSATITSLNASTLIGDTATYSTVNTTNITNTNLTGSQATFDSANIGTLKFTTLTNTTSDITEGDNLYYTRVRFDSALGDGTSASIVRGHFSAAGDLSYDSSTGVFSFDVEQVYTKSNFDSDLGAALDGGTGITYDSSTDTISITDTGVTAATYGSATEIPVFTVNAQGQLDSAGTVTVAGVSSLSFDSNTGNISIGTADGATFITTATLDPYTTSTLSEGDNLYYTRARFDSALGDSASALSVRGHFSAGGDLSYNPTTGQFSFDVEQVYTKTNFDSDLGAALSGGTGITYDSANDAISITNTNVVAGTYGSASEVPVFTVNAQGQLDSAGTVTVAGVSNVSYDSASYTLTVSTADGGSFPAFLRTTSGVVAGTYGSATQIPIIKVDEFGEVDSVSTIAVAGVTSTSYDSATSIFTINTADGGTFTAKLDPQYLDADSAKITTLNLTTLTGTTANITNVTSDSATITNLANTTLTGQNATFDSAQITNISASTLASTTSLTLGSTLAYAQNFGSLSFNQDDFYGDSLNTVFMFTSQDSSDTSASVALGVRNQFQTVLGAVGTADSNQFVLGYPNANWQLLIKKDVGNTPYNLQGGTTLFEMDSNGDIKLASTTNSISRTTGSLVLAGGLGVGGNLRGNDIFSAGNMQAAGAFIGNVTGQVSDISNHSTTDLSEGNNLYYTQVRFDSAFGDKSTTDLSEGNNLYYTTARADSDAKNAISVSDAGGDGSLTYSASTGIITYNGPSATEVRAHLVAGTGVGYDSATGIISVGQPIGIADSVEFTGATINGNLTITGDFNVVGTQNITSQNDLRITNAIIKVADSNAQDIYDIGVVGRYGDDSGTIRRAGFVRDATNGEWYVFTNLIQDGLDSSQPDQTINFNDSSFELGTFNFGALRGSYLGFDSDFRVFSTNYTVTTSNITASSSQRVAADTSGGSFTITLPASPVTGDYVRIIDVGNWTDNSLFIGRNGSTIEGYADDFELDIGQNVVEFIYINNTWNVYTSIGQRGETGAQGTAADSAEFASTSESIAFAVALG